MDGWMDKLVNGGEEKMKFYFLILYVCVCVVFEIKNQQKLLSKKHGNDFKINEFLFCFFSVF